MFIVYYSSRTRTVHVPIAGDWTEECFNDFINYPIIISIELQSTIKFCYFISPSQVKITII